MARFVPDIPQRGRIVYTEKSEVVGGSIAAGAADKNGIKKKLNKKNTSYINT